MVLQSSNLSTHADWHSVDISFAVCLFVIFCVCLCVCTVTDFSSQDKASGKSVNPPEAPKSEESARGGEYR